MIDVAIVRGWNGFSVSLGEVLTLVAVTLLLGGAIHICAIFLVPALAQSDGWSRLATFAGSDRFQEIPVSSAASDGVAGLDPLFVNSACRISLDEAPAGITVEARDRFWSLALYDPRGTIVFSLNDRTAVEGRLDMIIVNADQNARLREAPSSEIEQSIVVESQPGDLIALLRLFAPTRSARQDARAILAEAECLPAPSILGEQ
ncbi:MAG TPA: hypothetical protein VGA77_01910 [Propylenella sp.]